MQADTGMSGANPAVFVGNGSLLIRCAQAWQEAGNRVAAVASADPTILAWACDQGLAAERFETELRLPGIEFDYLFSVANLRVLPLAALRRARRLALNFHDGPLPRYAGLNAPAWAVICGERHHGVTWHEMTGAVDQGRIARQQFLDIEPNETAASLNARCWEAGYQAFLAMLDPIGRGDLRLSAQHEPVCGFGRHLRPAALATLDWQQTASQLSALVRGLDFGNRANPLALPKVWLGDRLVMVREARVVDAGKVAAPGTVLDVSPARGGRLHVATADGALELRGLSPFDGGRALEGLSPGSVLPAVPASARGMLAHRQARLAQAEPHWRRVLGDLPDTRLPYPRRCSMQPADAQPEAAQGVLRLSLQAREGGAATLAGLCAWLSAITGEESVSVRYTDAVILEQAHELRPWVGAWVPVLMRTHAHRCVRQVCARADALMGQARQAGPMTRDLRWRLGVAAAPVPLPRVALCLGAGIPDEDEGDAPQVVLHAPQPNGGLFLLVDTTAFDPRVAWTMAQHLDAWLQAFAQAHGAVGDLPLAPDGELARIAKWNDTRVPVDAAGRIHAVIAGHAAAHPDDEAVRCGGVGLTHAQMQARVDPLARRLRLRGVGPGDVVGICLDRSPVLVAAVLAVLQCGAAYLPLDPQYPAERLRFMYEDARACCVICDEAAGALLGLPPGAALVPGLAGDGMPHEPAHEPSHQPPYVPRHAGPLTGRSDGQAAYVIYTSGSTGRPKGVVVSHANVLNFFAGMDARVPSGEGGRWLALTSLSFDISVLELLWTLARGFTVVLAPCARTAELPQAPQFSLFYFASDVRGSSDRYRLLLEGARFADANGFCAVWTPERHFHAFGGSYPNPALTCAALAAITSRVQLRAGSCVLPLHHPVRVAEDWAVVDNLSGGRVGVSFASGWQPQDFVLAPQAFAARRQVMLEGIDAVRRLWRGEPIECAGPQGEAVHVRTLPRPVQPQLPVWITAASNPETFEQAGRAGCHLLTHLLGQSIPEVAAKVARYRAAWRDAGQPGQGQVTVMVHAFIDDDAQVARDTARGPLKAYLRSAVDLIRQAAWTFPTFVQRAAADGRTPLDILEAQPLSDADMEALLEHAFERYASTSALIGSPAQGLGLVRSLQSAGVDEVACFIDFGIDTDTVLSHLPHLHQLMQLAQRPLQGQGQGMPGIAQLVGDEGITHMQCTPSLAGMLVADEAGRGALARLRALLVGGEALAVPLARELRERVGGRLLALYGPTETTVWSSCCEVETVEDFVPLGEPIANTSLQVRNAWGQECPALVPGELVIGGGGVSLGYLGRPELEAQRFIDDPAGGRLYRSGDLVRRHPDGRLEFLGRIDHQVKIRGHRVEPGEIEGVLLRQPGVREAVVAAQQHGTDGARLLAWVTLHPGSAGPAAEDLQRALARELPVVMRPQAVTVLERLPLTPNGKIDRSALLSAHAAHPCRTTAAIRPGAVAAAGLEQTVASIWSEVLARGDLARDANFFDVGGHSLAMVQVQRRLREATGVEVSMADMFRLTTITSLALHIGRSGQDGAMDRAVCEGLGRAQARRMLRPRPHAR